MAAGVREHQFSLLVDVDAQLSQIAPGLAALFERGQGAPKYEGDDRTYVNNGTSLVSAAARIVRLMGVQGPGESVRRLIGRRIPSHPLAVS